MLHSQFSAARAQLQQFVVAVGSGWANVDSDFGGLLWPEGCQGSFNRKTIDDHRCKVLPCFTGSYTPVHLLASLYQVVSLVFRAR